MSDFYIFKAFMVGHGGSSAGSYLADPTSPIPSHYAVIILFKSVPVHQLSWLALYLDLCMNQREQVCDQLGLQSYHYELPVYEWFSHSVIASCHFLIKTALRFEATLQTGSVGAWSAIFGCNWASCLSAGTCCEMCAFHCFWILIETTWSFTSSRGKCVIKVPCSSSTVFVVKGCYKLRVLYGDLTVHFKVLCVLCTRNAGTASW